ncbi:MAG: isoprenylcysteine carboxylmethyltransferase family protein [Acidimicrobiia bacterium]|nr:isoprenylcysteine carboxylmethyltransferase family protein [Acidimicrobiia bacterium]
MIKKSKSISINFERFARRGGWWVVAQFALFALILLALTGNRAAGPVPTFAGWALIGFAAVIGGSGLWMLRSKLTPLPAPVAGAVLLQDGPYAIVRHPIYSGVILGFLGLAVRGANPVAGLLALALIPFFYAKTLHEERLLITLFPEYAAYQRRVRYRVLPWVL